MTAARTAEPDWQALTDRSLEELKQAAPHYQPTNFWGPALDQLLADMRESGWENFKSWPTSTKWFYPIYVHAARSTASDDVRLPEGSAAHGWARRYGRAAAMRDFDVARATWDQARWPFDFRQYDESALGNPPERYRLQPHRDKTYGRAYLNYLLCLSALSHHVTEVPLSFLEIGGGYGGLGEVLLQRKRPFRYVDLDIPPLVTVASWYQWHRFPERDLRPYTESVPESGPFTLGRSGVLPNYRLEDLQDRFDVFVNTFSFQEMEPDVVEHYVDQVCRKGITYAVSFNSRNGKPKAERPKAWGVLDPVRSDDIVRMFVERGFEPVGRYGPPMVRSWAELVVLRRRDAVPTQRERAEATLRTGARRARALAGRVRGRLQR